jgi:LmbE family N-acetylglucosaminyl deacetylase
MASWRLLACFAHPDDEAFIGAGVLAMSIAQGGEAHLVCATYGEAGAIRTPGSATPETLAEVRHDELRQSCQVLGIPEPTMLGYRDSGWGDDPAQRHPKALVNAPDREVVQALIAAMRRVKPHVVFTFEPSGLSGHKDHIAISKHTTFAYQLAGDASVFPEHMREGLAPWRPQRLLYAARPKGYRLERARRLRRAGIDVPLPPREQWDIGVPLEQIHLMLDVEPYLDTKLASIRCHRTQVPPDWDDLRAPPEVTLATHGKEYVIQADPPLAAGEQLSSNLFAGLTADA